MNILIISASPRATSNSIKVSQRIGGLFETRGGVTLDVLDLSEDAPCAWSEAFYDANSSEAREWQACSERLQAADGFVIVAPEYGGMAPPQLMNLLLKCGLAETGHKPALLVGVSSGMGGVYPIAQLRQFGFKNSFLCMLPFNVIVRQADRAFLGHPDESAADTANDKRLAHGCELLVAYAGALASVRKSGIDHAAFRYGV